MARSKRPEDTVIRLVKCQRWGVCDEGTADICAVDLKTVHRFQRVAAQRAETHHCQVGCEVDVPGAQLDEAHSKELLCGGPLPRARHVCVPRTRTKRA